MQKLVIDTNIIISSILGKSYPHKIIVDLVFTNKVQLFLSPQILIEYQGVLSRNKFARISGFQSSAEEIIEFIGSLAIVTHSSLSLKLLQDESDNKFIDLAVSVDADFLITGNIKHFPFGKISNTEIISPMVYWRDYGNHL